MAIRVAVYDRGSDTVCRMAARTGHQLPCKVVRVGNNIGSAQVVLSLGLETLPLSS
ncbi:hypothetical protein ACFSJU_11670 [Paradesertivirga mongoliensis]|uniref:Uncharacterized protein n=1 Tax=Paradesertivirga mongoliensis TaxID=2100740 RepID=A0ABW4ZLT8_9SPHI|nr:hypothetical protein [Pedobacter mongoliensis]